MGEKVTINKVWFWLLRFVKSILWLLYWIVGGAFAWLLVSGALDWQVYAFILVCLALLWVKGVIRGSIDIKREQQARVARTTEKCPVCGEMNERTDPECYFCGAI